MLEKSKKSFRKQVFIVISVVVFISFLVVFYGISAVERFIKIDQTWREYSNESNKAGQLINQVRSGMGYGGVIHNFKNYVIRRDASLIPIIENDVLNCYRILEQYRTLHLTQDERDALKALEGVIKEYSNNLKIAQKLIAKGLSIEEIDKQVYVNDKPAVDALNLLVKTSFLSYRNKTSETNKIITETKAFAYYGLIIIPIVFILGLLFIFYLRKILEMNISLMFVRNELDGLLDGAPDATFVIDDKGKVIRANKQATDLFGYDISQIIGMSVEELMPEQYRQNHVGLRESYMNNVTSKNLAPGRMLDIVTKDNVIVPVDISLSYHERKDDKLVIATLRDMRSYSAFEEELKKERDFSNSIIETAQAIILVLDTKGCIVEFNPYMEKLFGHKLKDIKGMDYFSIFLPQHDQNKIREIFMSAIDDIQTKGHVNPLLTKYGDTIYVEWYDKTLKNKIGETTGLLAIGQDVTERFKSQEVIRLQGAIADNMAEGVNIVRASDGLLKYTNPKFDAMFGYEKGELVDKHVSILNANENNESMKVADDIFYYLDKHGYWHGEIKNVKKDGTVFWTESTVTCFNHSEYGDVYISVQTDSTQRKISEMALEEKESTIRALLNAPKDRLVLLDRAAHILAINKAEMESLNIKYDESIGKSYFDLINSNEKSLIIELINYAKNHKKPINKYDLFDDKWIDVTVYPILDTDKSVVQLAVLISDITDLKFNEEKRVIQEKQHKDILVREVHHRIKNNLQSVAGLLRRQGRKHSELKVHMSDAISQVESIAIVHGLQGAHGNNDKLGLVSLITKISEAVKHLYRDDVVITIKDDLRFKYTIKPNEAVPFALVINELITNSIKHCTNKEICETVIEIDNVASQSVQILIKNQGQLSSNFELTSDRLMGSGLKLVRSLLPADYAKFKLFLDNGHVVAELIIDSMILTQEQE